MAGALLCQGKRQCAGDKPYQPGRRLYRAHHGAENPGPSCFPGTSCFQGSGARSPKPATASAADCDPRPGSGYQRALALTLGLAPGDKLSLCPDKECKTPLTLPISAIYYDYGNPKGEVLLAQSLWQELKLPTEAVSLAVSGIATSAERAKGAGLTSIAALERALIQELGLSPVQVYSQQKKFAMRRFGSSTRPSALPWYSTP